MREHIVIDDIQSKSTYLMVLSSPVGAEYNKCTIDGNNYDVLRGWHMKDNIVGISGVHSFKGKEVKFYKE